MNSRSVDESSRQSSAPHPLEECEQPTLRPCDRQDPDTDAVAPNLHGVHFFGDYEMVGEIARGGMGVVFKARHRSLGRVVALKKILAGELACSADVRRFEIEAKAAAQLNHPNIVPIFEVGEIQGQHFFTMAFIDGVDLSTLALTGKLTPQRIATLVYYVALAIDYAHSQGVIHRDLKPSNILVDGEFVPYVMDFGLAKRLGDQSDLTQSGEVMGTPGYMAPEQASGKTHTIGALTDVYGIGAILYACLTRRPPFVAASPIETLVKILESEPVNPRTIDKSIPKPLERICLHCLEKEPANRYQSALAVAKDLDRFLSGQLISAESPSLLNAIKRFTKQYPGFSAHTISIGFAFGIAQIRFAWTHQKNLTEHIEVSVLLATWLLFCILCQFLGVRRAVAKQLLWWESFWLCSDAFFFSGLMYLLTSTTNDPAILLIGYPMLIVASGLFFRVRLVFLVTVMSIATFVALQVATCHIPRYLHYQIAYVVMLFIIGLSVVHMIRRVRLLSVYFESARKPEAAPITHSSRSQSFN